MNNNSQSNKLEDIVFWYKAEMHGEFRIGGQEFWNYSAQHLREQGHDNNAYDPNAARRLRGPQIVVKKVM